MSELVDLSSASSPRAKKVLLPHAVTEELGQVFEDERLYTSSAPRWRYLPTPDQAAARRRRDVILLRRGRRPRKHPVTMSEWAALKGEQEELADELAACGPEHRCGSLACLECRAAFVRAVCPAARKFAQSVRERWADEQHHLTIVPFQLQFAETTLGSFDPIAANQQLQTAMSMLAGSGFAIGTIELSYEEVVGRGSYWQPHWHVLAAGSNLDAVISTLRQVLPNAGPNRPSVVAPVIYDLRGAARYVWKAQDKGHRWVADASDRPARRVIPDVRRRELLLWLHRWAPWRLLVTRNAALTFSEGRLRFRTAFDQGAT